MGALFSKDRFDPTKDLVDLKGKVVIVTGGNRGIGYGTVKHFAKAGAKVYIAARNEKAALDAIESLYSDGLEPGNGELKWLKFDQSDPREAKKSAEEFLKRESRLDILVLNAAITRGDYELTPDAGISTMVIVNHISPVAFTNTLLPLMTETARLPDTDVRIVNVSSGAMRLVPTAGLSFKRIEDLNVDFKGHYSDVLYRYGHSKLLGVMWTRSLQKHLDESDPPVPITVIAAHPGTVKTFIDRPDVPLVWKWYGRAFGVDIDQGAYNSMFAAASKQVAQERERYKGQYIEPVGKIITPPEAATDKGNEEDLWRTTEDLLRKLGI